MLCENTLENLSFLETVQKISNQHLMSYYLYPDLLTRCWIRGNMISSLDGSSTKDGRSGGLANINDRAIFSIIRQSADIIIVGASTVLIEEYSNVCLSINQQNERKKYGQSNIPQIAVITTSSKLKKSDKFFSLNKKQVPFVFTSANNFINTQKRLNMSAEVVNVSSKNPEKIDFFTIVKFLAERKFFRILIEGGPFILGKLMEKNILNELCLTISPILIGGKSKRIAISTKQLEVRMQPLSLLMDNEGYFYIRYIRT